MWVCVSVWQWLCRVPAPGSGFVWISSVSAGLLVPSESHCESMLIYCWRITLCNHPIEMCKVITEDWTCVIVCQSERMLELLAVFESGPMARLDLKQHYLLLLQRYSRELEQLRKTYQKQRERPPIGRNLPPVQTPVCLSQCISG